MRIKYREFVHSVGILFVTASLFHPPIVLASEQSDTSIRKGIEAYEAGDYYLALEYFADAEIPGSPRIALYYNIGVAHYKLGQYEEADEAFKKVAQLPEWEALALYNRALIAYRTDQPELAKEFAAKSIGVSKNPGLTALNYRLLDSLDSDGSDESAWSNLVHFALGYNDNVILADADASAISGEGDAYFGVVGRAKRAMNSDNSSRLNLVVQASLHDYVKLNEYDQFGLRGGIEREWGRPQNALGAYLEHVSLGGQSYELLTSFKYRRTLSNEKNKPAEFTYAFNHYTMLNSDFAQLGGVRHRLQLDKEKYSNKGSLKTYIRTEYNDREDQKIMGNFYSFSPVRVGIGTVYTKNFSSSRAFSGSLYLQQSRFLDPDKRLGVFKTRQDSFLEYRLSLTHVSTARWIFRANYIAATNRSNYSEYSYNQNIVSLEINKSF